MSPGRLDRLVRPRGCGGRPRRGVGGAALPLVAEGAGGGGAGGVRAEVELVGVEGGCCGGAGGGSVAGVGVHGGRKRGRSARRGETRRWGLAALSSVYFIFFLSFLMPRCFGGSCGGSIIVGPCREVCAVGPVWASLPFMFVSTRKD